MRFLTDRKRAAGLGSGREGTRHHWRMITGSILLAPLAPAMVVLLARAMGGTRAEVAEFLGRPVPAIAMALALVVVARHLAREAQAAIEDYVHGAAGKLALVATNALAHALAAAGLFAIARMAL